jgi:hypothetical protein
MRLLGIEGQSPGLRGASLCKAMVEAIEVRLVNKELNGIKHDDSFIEDRPAIEIK